ncbi:Dyp-type peroxidase [Hyalangium versicolor]|uniref:Dyp-type peroxidase n=1 Tax=Hyalangium versicolor TaxID=2861190 RepID=UPI001CCDB6BE|nr:Dyp-type peroxidase [Hyalangium versicolor]
MEELQYEDIQGLLRFGYGYLPCARYLFLQVKKGDAARIRAKEWLASIVGSVANAADAPRRERPARVLQIAFTADGLDAFGLFKKGEEGERLMGTFLPEFVKGMAEENRAKKLGDTGGSEPKRWCFGGPQKEKRIHVALILFAQTPDELEAFFQEHRQQYTDALHEVFKQDAALRPVSQEAASPSSEEDSEKTLFVEPFGFMDGISRVVAKGFPSQKEGRGRTTVTEVEPGEFILGYPNAYNQQAAPPLVPTAMDPDNTLRVNERYPSWKEWGRNGTYMVIRKLRQDVRAFERFLEDNCQHLRAEAQDADPKEYLAAKLMGRWRSGAPLALSPDRDDPRLGRDISCNNDFSYAGDEQGLRCPFSAHIRRSNPRDSLSPDQPPKAALESVNRHQIIRRGRPYRDSVSHGAKDPQEGLLFVALNANIGRQFEFIQQTWINSPKFHGLYDSRDAIAGNNHDPAVKDSKADDYAVNIPTSASPLQTRITGVPRFVHVEGGGYFFLPGINALRVLSRLPASDGDS